MSFNQVMGCQLGGWIHGGSAQGHSSGIRIASRQERLPPGQFFPSAFLGNRPSGCHSKQLLQNGHF